MIIKGSVLLIMTLSILIYRPFSMAEEFSMDSDIKAELEDRDFLKSFSLELAKKKGEISDIEKELKRINSIINTPLGEIKKPIPPLCNPHVLEKNLLSNYQNAKQFALSAKEYFDQCSKYLTKGNLVGLLGLIKFSTVSYNLLNNPLIQSQKLSLSDGTKIEAFIGIKDLNTQRPWIILKCGVFCDIKNSASTSNFIINFFDQSPFNILFVSNFTGTSYIKDNLSLRMGGFFEVYDFYDIAHWLKNESPYKNTVDSIHAVGVSLGGSAALAVSYLENLYQSEDGSPLFNSTTAICPVVNLGPTLKDMYSNSIKGKIFTSLTWKYLKKAAPYLKGTEDYLNPTDPPKTELFPPMLVDIVLMYGEEWEKSNPPGRKAPYLDSGEDYLNHNFFSDISKQKINIPTLAWASTDDSVVDYDLNTKRLIDTPNSNDNLGAFSLDYGNHCGFSTAYGYGTTTSVLQSFIINNSPNFKSKAKVYSTQLVNTLPKLKPGEIHLKQWWLTTVNSPYLALNFEIFNPNQRRSCKNKDPYKSGIECHRFYSIPVAIDDLNSLNLSIPTNSTELQVLIRKLNGQVRAVNLTQPIDGTDLPPTHLMWIDY